MRDACSVHSNAQANVDKEGMWKVYFQDNECLIQETLYEIYIMKMKKSRLSNT